MGAPLALLLRAIEFDLLDLSVALGSFGPEVPLDHVNVHLLVKEVLPVAHRDVEEGLEQVWRRVNLTNTPGIVCIEFGDCLQELVSMGLVRFEHAYLHVSRERGQARRKASQRRHLIEHVAKPGHLVQKVQAAAW